MHYICVIIGHGTCVDLVNARWKMSVYAVRRVSQFFEELQHQTGDISILESSSYWRHEETQSATSFPAIQYTFIRNVTLSGLSIGQRPFLPMVSYQRYNRWTTPEYESSNPQCHDQHIHARMERLRCNTIGRDRSHPAAWRFCSYTLSQRRSLPDFLSSSNWLRQLRVRLFATNIPSRAQPHLHIISGTPVFFIRHNTQSLRQKLTPSQTRPTTHQSYSIHVPKSSPDTVLIPQASRAQIPRRLEHELRTTAQGSTHTTTKCRF
jgi:hypothetical protein